MATAEPRPRADWSAYRVDFPIFERKVYLNTCSLGALSTRVGAAVSRFLALWAEEGAPAWFGPWWEELGRLRARMAEILHASPAEIALFPSITAALTAVASCFDYRARPRVVLSDLEFPTTAYQWLAKRDRGVEVEMLRSPDRMTVPAEAFERAVDERTQLVAVSHVYFTSGVIQDITTLARIAHARGAYLLVDAYQSVGQLPLDVRASGVDFLVTGGLKWLLGGPGIAALYVRRELHGTLRPADVGWFAHRDQFAFDVTQFEHAPDARGFEGGTPALAAVYAGQAGVDIVAEIGVERLRARQQLLLADLVERLRTRRLSPRILGDPVRHAGIVTVPFGDPTRVVRALAARGIVVDARPGVIRISPYFYNAVEDNEAIAGALVALAA
ncbi:MAG: aminotransferase class V-fold PLP-dependent enzyme [Armatimonadetes bacterium]|nr:aminotransferase class V-fold PLP-dependent enzyme [Armatimonadota bacterium]